MTPPAGEGRWSLTREPSAKTTDTQWSAATAQQLLARYGVVTREVAALEALPGGFSAVYDVLKHMEERGRVRRGYFVAGVGAVQFAVPAALDLLRSLKDDPESAEVVTLAATDPANAHGVLLKWPAPDSVLPAAARGATRSGGALVVLVNGALGAWVGRQGRQVLSFLPENEPERSRVGRAVAGSLAHLASEGEGREGGLLVGEINGQPAERHPLAPFLVEAGFLASALGFVRPRGREPQPRHVKPGGRATGLRSSPWSALR